jgi:hypothetical protein
LRFERGQSVARDVQIHTAHFSPFSGKEKGT